MRPAASLMSPVSGAARDNKWPSKQQAEQQPGFHLCLHKKTKQQQQQQQINSPDSDCFICALNNFTPHSLKGDFNFMPCTYSYTDFYLS